MLRDFFIYVGFRVKDWYLEIKKRDGFKHVFHKAAIFVAFVLWLIAAVKAVVNDYRYSGREEIIMAFNNEGYESMEAVISAYGKYDGADISDSAKTIVLENIAEEIGVRDYDITSEKDNAMEVVKIEKESVNGAVECAFISAGSENENLRNQYISIKVCLSDSIESAFDYERIVKKIVNKLNMDCTVSVNLKGEIAGKLSNGMKNIMADGIFGVIDADIVASQKDDELYTIYAYDKDIDSYISIGNKKVNVNFSVAYDETRDVTNVYLSTPINNSDF